MNRKSSKEMGFDLLAQALILRDFMNKVFLFVNSHNISLSQKEISETLSAEHAVNIQLGILLGCFAQNNELQKEFIVFCGEYYQSFPELSENASRIFAEFGFEQAELDLDAAQKQYGVDFHHAYGHA